MAGGAIGDGGGTLKRAHLYENKITWYFLFSCAVGALGGSLFGYDLGVSGLFFLHMIIFLENSLSLCSPPICQTQIQFYVTLLRCFVLFVGFAISHRFRFLCLSSPLQWSCYYHENMKLFSIFIIFFNE